MASAAAWILPSCISDPKKVSLALNRLQITGEEEEFLGSLASTMIPATETPGAHETGAHLFALVMVDDCLSKADQEKYLKGMRNFDGAVKKLTGKTFSSAAAGDRLQILTSFEKDIESVDEDVKSFYTQTRSYIIQGYTASQHFLTEVKPYQLVPGPNYNGCAPLTTDQKTIS
jgi:hypothetical protein